MPSKPKATALSTAGVLPILRARFIFLFVFSGYDSWFRLFAPNFCLSDPGLNKLALRAENIWDLPPWFRLVTGWKQLGLKIGVILWQAVDFTWKFLRTTLIWTEKSPRCVSSVTVTWKYLSGFLSWLAPALWHFLPCDFSFSFPSAPLLFGFLQPSASSLLSCKQLQKLQYDSVFFLKSSK